MQVPGKGECPQRGQTAVIDWDGYTIGYYGRPFEARNKVCPESRHCSPSTRHLYLAGHLVHQIV